MPQSLNIALCALRTGSLLQKLEMNFIFFIFLENSRCLAREYFSFWCEIISPGTFMFSKSEIFSLII
jgi:hypothetical protein